LVAQCVVLHVDSNEVVKSRSWKTEDARDFFCVEEVGGFIPVNPHTTKIVAEEVVERIARQETQTIRNPVRLVSNIYIVGLDPLSHLTNGFGTLLISTRPHSQCDTVECMRRILLEDEGMVNTMRLALARADLDIVRKASLQE